MATDYDYDVNPPKPGSRGDVVSLRRPVQRCGARFQVKMNLDSAWLAAQPVTYPKAKPAVYTADGWAELLTMQNELAVRKMLHVSTYTKAPDWSYENEWRVVTFKGPTESKHFADYSTKRDFQIGRFTRLSNRR